MEAILLVVHILVAATLIGLILLQQGKGADMGAAFGSGSAGSLFGSAGSANFLSRSTAILATVFFLLSLGLSYLSMHRSTPTSAMQSSVMQNVPAKPADAPAAPASGTAAPATPADAGSKGKEIPN